MNARYQLREAQKKIAKLTAERDVLKAACHRHAAKRPNAEWTMLNQRIDALQAELELAERALAARDPQRRREMRREQRQRRAA